MASNTRIPKAELTGLYGAMVKRMSRKMLGDVPEPVEVAWHNRKVLNFSFGVGRKVAEVGPVRREPEVVRPHGGGLPGRLQLVPGPRLLPGPQRGARRGQGARGAAVARVRRLHAAGARRHGVRRGDDPDPADRDRRDVGRGCSTSSARPRWSSSPRSSALANLYTRTNVALGIESEGFSAACGLKPLAEPSQRHDRATRSSPTAACSSPSPTRCSAPPPTPRTSCRRPGCGGPTSTAPRCATRARTWSGSSPGRRSTGCGRVARRREEYVGEWLPEPLLTSPDVAEDVELAESVSIAMLTVLETLAPAERAVFVLREVFDLPYDEIAEAVDKSPAAVRQIAHRAREHVAARRPRIAGRSRRAAAGGRALPGGGADRRSPGPARRARARRGARRRRRRRGGRCPESGGGQRPGGGPPLALQDGSRGVRWSALCGSTVRPPAGSTSPASSTRRSAWWSRRAGSPASTRSATRTSLPGSTKRPPSAADRRRRRRHHRATPGDQPTR